MKRRKSWPPRKAYQIYYSILREITKAERADKHYWEKDAKRLRDLDLIEQQRKGVHDD